MPKKQKKDVFDQWQQLTQTSSVIRSPWLWLTFLACMALFSSLSCKSSAVHETPPTKSTQPPQQQPVDNDQPCPAEENQQLIEAYLAVQHLSSNGGLSPRARTALRRHSCQTMKDSVGAHLRYHILARCSHYFQMVTFYNQPEVFLEQYLVWASAGDKDSLDPMAKLGTFINKMPLPDGKPENHFCQPTEKYCQEHSNCTSSGQCGFTAVKNDLWGMRYQCSGVTAESCAASFHCKSSGRCSPSPDQSRCIVATPDDCKHTEGCKAQGLCIPDDTGFQCVDPHENCEDKAVCKWHGQCVTAGESNDNKWCTVERHADCEASKSCKENGRCTAIFTDTPYQHPACAVAFDSDCEQSTDCKEKGLCKFAELEGCVKESPHLEGDGWPLDHVCPKDTVREVQRRCVIDIDLQKKCSQDFVICSPTPAYCKQQPACKTDGHCGVKVSEELESETENPFLYECSKADGNERCSPGHKYCALNAEGCAQFEACQLSGKCSTHYVVADYGYQQSYDVCAPRSDADCAQSEYCKKYGACTYISTEMMPPERTHIDIPFCAPNSAKDCQQSEACIKENLCRFQPGSNLPSDSGNCVP